MSIAVPLVLRLWCRVQAAESKGRCDVRVMLSAGRSLAGPYLTLAAQQPFVFPRHSYCSGNRVDSILTIDCEDPLGIARCRHSRIHYPPPQTGARLGFQEE